MLQTSMLCLHASELELRSAAPRDLIGVRAIWREVGVKDGEVLGALAVETAYGRAFGVAAGEVPKGCRYLRQIPAPNTCGGAGTTRLGEALSVGMPIASGVIEGAFRHLLRDRLDCGRARWGVVGAEGILKLRARVTSGDFDNYGDYPMQ